MDNKLESAIQAEIIQWAQHNGYYLHSVPNEGAGQNLQMTLRLIAQGMRPGVADLLLWLGDSRVAYIEVKTQTGRQSEKQKQFQKRCESFGYPYRLVRSLADFQFVVQELKPEKCFTKEAQT